MVKRMQGSASKYAIVAFLFCAQIHAQIDLASPSCYSTCKASESSHLFWADVDYLYWKIQNSPEPIPVVIQGATSVVLGGKKIDTGWRSGARAAFGFWFNRNSCFGTEVDYFILPSRSKKHSVRSNGSILLSVPCFNVVTAAEDSIPIANPLLSIAGAATLKLTNAMQGAEWSALMTIPAGFCRSQVIALTGFRYWNFREHLTFLTNSPFNPPHVPDVYMTKEQFKTKNNFYGGQLGLIWEYAYKYFSITAKGRVALGAMCESLVINGYLRTNDYNGFGAVLEYPGGYFALPTNIGRHKRTKFAAIPEFDFNIGYQLFDWMRIRLGYTFIYVSNVLRAGKQIDHKINPSK